MEKTKRKYDYQKNKEYQKNYQKTSEKPKQARERYRKKNLHLWRKASKKYWESPRGRLKYIMDKSGMVAARKLLPFDLTIEWMETYPDVCPLLRIPLLLGQERGSPNTPAIDMIDPNLGYTQKNCRIISSRAKEFLSTGTLDDMEKIIQNSRIYVELSNRRD